MFSAIGSNSVSGSEIGAAVVNISSAILAAVSPICFAKVSS